jgi:hypothetical protein
MPSGREESVGNGIRRGVPVVLAFGQTGAKERSGFEHADLIARIGRQREQPFSRIFLHDPSGTGFYRGVSWLRGAIDEVVAALRSLIKELAPSAIITFGEGLGGHAALVYGGLLGASRIVAIEPPAHLIADELASHNDHRWERALVELPEPEIARHYDVPSLFKRIGYTGRAFILLGSRRGNDHHDAVSHNVIHAHRLALSDQVTLCPFPEVGQGLLSVLSECGEAEQVLGSYLFDDPGPLSEGPRTGVDVDPRDERVDQFYYGFQFSLCNIKESRGYGGTSESAAYAAVGVVNPRAHRRVDDGWHRWIAENLMLDASPASLETTLQANGFTEDEATLEVNRALESPYILGARRLKSRCAKRDWMLATYRKLHRLDPRSAGIERQHRLTGGAFLEEYYASSRPVLLTGMMDDWPARGNWSYDLLAPRFEGRSEGDSLPLDALGEDLIPIPEFLDGRNRGGGRLRLGPVGTISPFHQNASNVLLGLVFGRLRLRLAPWWDGPLFGDTREGAAPPDPRPTPRLSTLALDQPQILECLLNGGEFLFLPVGWWSGVETLEPSVALEFTEFFFDSDFPGPDGNEADR